jgi:hypothetical protein
MRHLAGYIDTNTTNADLSNVSILRSELRMMGNTTRMTIPLWPGLDKKQQLVIRKMASMEAVEHMTTVQVMRTLRDPGRMMKIRLEQIEKQKALEKSWKALEERQKAVTGERGTENMTKRQPSDTDRASSALA